MTTPIYTVYKTTNTINNKIYIGVHKTTNSNDSYLGSGNLIKKAILKYGKESFTKSILFEYDNSEDAYLKESQIVNNSFIKQTNTYNISMGGLGGKELTQSHKNQIRKSRIGKKASKLTIEKMSKSQKGRHHSFEVKMKMSKSRKSFTNKNFKGYYITPWGKFKSSVDATYNQSITDYSIRKWCVFSNKVICYRSLSRSKYLKSLKESPLGKTFKDIGFNFI